MNFSASASIPLQMVLLPIASNVFSSLAQAERFHARC